ncbi:hypothetical protein K505DRAFT_330760 [Melanomma pulvis-pyrius CBS 109.77]|uniref:Chalcone isomerase domain-containing protein n=1 Tax=Melanomma pulvis-pyrius CBS 109.77 TaxID=1314802 RepID=A0A6A6WPH8_9PLEO|nr:hypothetical protein K505DRAFT_330760 [Melanomma pulvis-pyrius CBS 109.77]
MTPARLASRRPILRCLNSPSAPLRSNPQLRHLSRELPKLRADAEALLSKGSRRGGLGPTADEVSLHRAQALRRAQLVRRRNWLALGAALSMIAPMVLVRFWPMPPPMEKEGSETEGEMKGEEKGSKGVLDLLKPRPTQTDSPRRATEEFQGKQVVIAAGDKIIAAPASSKHPSASDVDAVELVPTGTSYVPYFPRTITIPTASGPEGAESEAEYTLLGLGIRKVSFLRVQVYVVGLYIRTSSLSTLQNHLINTVNPTASALIPGEKEDLRSALLDSEKSSQIWESILSRRGPDAPEMAFRIVPCRGTDFKHLQDGWMRGVASRTDEVRRKQSDLLRQQAAESKQIALPKPVDESEFSDESFGLAMKDFKGLFQGRGKAPKGSVILLTRDSQGVLGALYQPLKASKGEDAGKVSRLGEVKDERVSRLVWLLYLGGQNVSSEEARKSVVDGCISIVERPVGTVEGMVQ